MSILGGRGSGLGNRIRWGLFILSNRAKVWKSSNWKDSQRRTKSSGECMEKADQEEDLKPWVLILYLRISSQKALRFFMASFAALLMFPWFAARSPWM